MKEEPKPGMGLVFASRAQDCPGSWLPFCPGGQAVWPMWTAGAGWSCLKGTRPVQLPTGGGAVPAVVSPQSPWEEGLPLGLLPAHGDNSSQATSEDHTGALASARCGSWTGDGQRGREGEAKTQEEGTVLPQDRSGVWSHPVGRWKQKPLCLC